jgi:prohibitin 2
MNKLGKFAIMLIASFGLAACSEVPVGSKGVSVTQGTLNGIEDAGLVWHGPLTDIIPISVQTLKWEAETSTYTKDVQQADVKFTVSYRLDPGAVRKTYETYGESWSQATIPQVVEESIKDAFGKSEAVKDAINNRGKIQSAIKADITKKLRKKSVIVEGFELNDISFSKDFDKANEAKQIAVETANAERNKTVAVQERAKQKIITAEADAEAMKIKSQALSGNAGLTAYEYAVRWDGKMPMYVTGSNAPMMMMGKK